MHTLQEFVLKSALPAIRQLGKARKAVDLPTKRGAYASVFESYLWLHLGSEVAIFPLEPAQSVFASYYSRFFESLNAQEDRLLKESEDLFRSRLYVTDTVESRELKATFPDFTILIELAMKGENGFRFQRNEFQEPGSLRPMCRNFLRVGLSVASDPLVRSFTNLSQFTDANQWESRWRGGDCNPEQVMTARTLGGKSPDPAVICAGFLKLWGYSYQLRQMSEMYEHENIRSDDRFRLIDRIKTILRWRINLRSTELAARFESVKAMLKRNLDEQVANERVENAEGLRNSVEVITKSFDESFDFWLVGMTARA